MKRLHPRSAVFSVARAVFQGLLFGLFAATSLTGVLGLPGWAVPVLVPLGGLLAGGFAVARYYRFRYAISNGTLIVESGVFARQSREIPLGRIQNVDLTQGVINRVLGLTVVAFETAGGSTTEATLSAVDEAEATRLRRLVQRHGSDHDETDDADGIAIPSTSVQRRDELDGDDAEELFAFTFSDLLTYAAVSIRPAAPALLLAGIPLGLDVLTAIVRFNAGVVGGDATPSLVAVTRFGPPRLVGFVALTLVQFLLAALVLSIVFTVVEYYDFRLLRDGDDLRYQRGLIRRYSGTIPLSKVQTVSVSENVLMRRFGFATLTVETAGYSGGTQQSTQGVAIPLAPREEVYALARDIEPFGDLDFERPPTRARRRYTARFTIVVGLLTVVAYTVDQWLVASGNWWLALGLLVVVPLAAHLRWRHRGVTVTDDVLATRSGFWRQTTRIVPYYRVQTVFVGRSPFQRRRRLASVTADTASTTSILGGAATAYDVDDNRATELRTELRRRLYEDLQRRRGAVDSTTVESETGDSSDL